MPSTPGRSRPVGRVLFAGTAYYNTWYLSRALRKLGWKADVLNWDSNEANMAQYHGADHSFRYGRGVVLQHLAYYMRALASYDVFHFSNAHGMCFGFPLEEAFARYARPGAELQLIKRLGKKIVYTNNGCLDGVAQSSFRRWGPEPVCDICPWQHRPDICSDERNLTWGRYRNHFADYQALLGGNRADYNVDPRVHEVPEFFCLDPDVWSPDLEIPDRFRLDGPPETVRLFHAVGNFDERTAAGTLRNIKSTHIYVPLVEELKHEGLPVELVFPRGVPNLELRYFQAQSDIFVDMLTYGWFGATAREGMMLGKPVVCYLRPAWLESMREEIPEYVDELPVISATPDTAPDVVRNLVMDRARRLEIGRRSREFALKWHSAEAGGRRFDRIYRELLGIPLA